VVVGGYAFALGCVGDSNTTVVQNDAGDDASAVDSATSTDGTTGVADAGVADQSAPSDASTTGVDAGPRICDPSKAFGSAVLVSSLTAPYGNSGTFRLMKDLATGYFDSTREGGAGGSDVWMATRVDGGPFATATNVASVDTASEEAYPTISGDGLTLVFASDRPNGAGAEDLWVATRNTTLVDFGTPAQLANVNTISTENAPYLRSDGKKLYFSSDRSPSQGADDIWVSTLNGSSFGAPVHVDELASSTSDAYATVTSDDLVMYFASQRTGGKGGGRDIWVATRATASDPFSGLTPVAELNTAFEDLPSFITDDRCTLYLTSNAAGRFQVYVATKSP
jgi:hypothetical protein